MFASSPNIVLPLHLGHPSFFVVWVNPQVKRLARATAPIFAALALVAHFGWLPEITQGPYVSDPAAGASLVYRSAILGPWAFPGTVNCNVHVDSGEVGRHRGVEQSQFAVWRNGGRHSLLRREADESQQDMGELHDR